MITAFNKIKGVGRYKDFTVNQVSEDKKPSNFKQYNLIYGENGSGKTTLTHILRSLKGADDFLLKKKSFNYFDSPEVIIQTQGLTTSGLNYQAFKWQQHFPAIEIFDVHFINNNIYTGLEIQNDHKKKLFEIILGDEGVRLKNKIQEIKVRIRNGNKIVRASSRTLEEQINQAFTALAYANLSADEEVQEKLKWKEKELELAVNHQLIEQKPTLSPLPTITLPFDLTIAKSVLQQSMEAISTDYLDQLLVHKKQLKFEKAEEWLQQGFFHKYDDKCPFCLQKMDNNLAILKAYQHYFNKSYQQHLRDSHQLNTSLVNFNLAAILLQIENTITVNHRLVDFWKSYIEKTPELPSITSETTLLLAAFGKLKTLLDQKSRNPMQAIPTDDLKEFENIFKQVTNKIAEINESINRYNDSIESMKAHSNTNVAGIEKELNELKAIAKRAEPDIAEHCMLLLKYTAAITQLKRQNEAKKSELNVYKNNVFHSYLTILNRHLKHFAPYLSLQKLTSGYLGSSTEPVVKFALCINGKEVLHKEKENRISMKYALSEGDKNALALAFFLAKLETDRQLSKKIIVFDDTVSNFDRNRQSKLLNQLIHFGQKSRQLFFLTHDLRLGQEFVRRVQKAALPITTCQLQFFDGTTNLVNM
ncbi:MAG: AAA family ATPase [Bacteroidota bacterium]